MASQTMIAASSESREGSQDTQLIREALCAELGVPSCTGSSVPRLSLTCSEQDRDRSRGHDPRRSQPSHPNDSRSQTPERLPPARDDNATHRSFILPAPPPPPPKPRPPTIKSQSTHGPLKLNLMQGVEHRDDGPETQLPDTLLPDTLLPPATQAIGNGSDDGPASLHSLGSRKEPSQQTPTQVNDGRDYDKGYEMPSSEHGIDMGDTQASTLEGRTLHDDDTGAVNFGSLADYPRQSSQVSEDGGFENARGGWRLPDDTQRTSMHAETPYKNGELPPPETPALPKNPFAAQGGGAGAFGAAPAPLGGTQLFGQTQLLTSAVKHSPTSSRPSPNLFNTMSPPGFAETSPLKNRTNVSSPTDIRSSSPARLHEVPATVVKGPHMSMIAEETPTMGRISKEDRVSESPTRPRSAERQPLAHYEPMQQSQARKTSSDSVKVVLSFERDTHDTVEQLERRRRIERKRARAGEELDKITFARPVKMSDRAEANGKRRRLDQNSQSISHQQEQVSTESSAPAALPGSHEQSLESTKATPGGEENAEGITLDETADNGAQDNIVSDIAEYDMIPATSPVQLTPAEEANRAETPASEPDLPVLREQHPAISSGESSSLPPLRSKRRTYGGRARIRRNLVLDSSNSHATSAGVESSKHDAAEEDTPNEEACFLSEELTPMATRSRSKNQSPQMPMQLSGNVTSTAASSLSALSHTPNPSCKTTPATKESVASKTADADAGQALTPTRSLRRRAVEKDSAVLPPTFSARSLRASKRLHSHSELQSSGQPRTPSETGAATTFSERISLRLDPVYREERRLFEGMVFAISVDEHRRKFESGIVQAGGTVLQDGFQELFQALPSITSTDGASDDNAELALSQVGVESGFTALIADGHSRKAKYMQALALGLPCLAQQWITACLQKGALIDWQPYLLCAGASAVLGNAVRSRCLVPYPADTALLADTIDQRPRLLRGQSVLVVMDGKKARSEAKQPYLFLCHALGAAITRVATVEQGRAALAESAGSGHPFTWLYIDKATGTAEAVLARPAVKSKKKKRKAPPATPAGAGVRVLHDELIVQSLILGRIVEPEEDSF
ncbi:brct domain containing protein [Cordyceps fumosorosea ARSEF 2679]|uniref:Brct domain containing protein n=1 Tax=Cordyceps fumosorosea (strain ARSEF 2679) TaxID=1081104 RepID=A0A168CL52_CORFA|nr:brct domain containing protein [Cordyceps fumosorosea ARSEF 2679]OAA71510.1 brct domain containing protein [Cordyceps fumosorosea ARSEF 2679]